MSTGTNKERIEQNNLKLEEIKSQVQNLPEYQDTSDANAIANDIVINKYSKFSDELEFLDYWVDNFPKSKVLGSVSKFSFTRSWEFNIQSDFVNPVANRGSVIIEGNGHSLIINTNTWENLNQLLNYYKRTLLTYII